VSHDLTPVSVKVRTGQSSSSLRLLVIFAFSPSAPIGGAEVSGGILADTLARSAQVRRLAPAWRSPPEKGVWSGSSSEDSTNESVDSEGPGESFFFGAGGRTGRSYADRIRLLPAAVRAVGQHVRAFSPDWVIASSSDAVPWAVAGARLAFPGKRPRVAAVMRDHGWWCPIHTCRLTRGTPYSDCGTRRFLETCSGEYMERYASSRQGGAYRIGLFQRWLYAGLLRSGLRAVDQVLSVSQDLANAWQERTGKEAVAIGNPVPSLDGVGHLASRPSVDECRVVFMGRGSPGKGAGLLCETMRLLPAEAGWKFSAYGALGDTQESPLLDRRPRVSHREALAVMSRADLVVVPSVSLEALPRTAFEAQLVGTPVVTTNRGGTREAVAPTGGIVVSSCSPGDFAKGLEEARRKLVAGEFDMAAARAWVDTQFAPAAVADRFLTALRAQGKSVGAGAHQVTGAGVAVMEDEASQGASKFARLVNKSRKPGKSPKTRRGDKKLQTLSPAVLFVLPPGGSLESLWRNGQLERFFRYWVGYYRDRGFSVGILSCGARAREEELLTARGVDFLCAPRVVLAEYWGWVWSFLAGIVLARQGNFPVWRGMQATAVGSLYLGKKLQGAHTVVTYGYDYVGLSQLHGHTLRAKLLSSLFSVGLAQMERVIVTTERLRADAAEFGARDAALVVIPNGAEVAPAPLLRSARTGLLWVGRISAEKRVDDAIEIAARSGCALTVIGAGSLSVAQRERLAETGGRFLGVLPHSEMLSHMDSAIALLSTSVTEGMQKTVVEAFSRGTPAIIPTLERFDWFIAQDPAVVAAYPLGDIAAATSAVCSLVSDDIAHKKLSVAGYNLACSQLDLRLLMEQEVDLACSLLKDGS